MLNLKNIRKTYGGAVALNNVSIDIYEGEVHSLVGENGAGKSTLIKIITGAVKQNSGEIYLDNKKISHNSPRESLEKGITAVYQELNLIPSLTIYENIFYGIEKVSGFKLDKKTMIKESENILKSLNVNLKVTTKVEDLGMGNKQIIEIAKALAQKSRLIIFDEPTASLTEEEVERLFKIINDLREKNLAIIYISHKLEEVTYLSDKITLLRDGNYIETIENKNKTKDNKEMKNYLIKQMTGREINDNWEKPQNPSEEVILELKNVTTKNVKDISFKLKKGEILSISGLLGSMRTEVLNSIFGIDKITSGEIIINGKKAKIKSPQDAIKHKIGYVSEDRKDSGLFMELPLRENTSMVFLKDYSTPLYIDKKTEEIKIKDLYKKLTVKYSSLTQKAKELSGGNQQKVSIGKWLIGNLDIILLDEPTRGVDVGAKEEIYRLILDLAKEGKSIIMVSSEAEEVMRLSHRTIVMSNGKMATELEREEISPEKIYRASAQEL